MNLKSVEQPKQQSVFKRCNDHPILTVSIAAAATAGCAGIAKICPFIGTPVKALTDYYLSNPSIFWPVIWAEMGMTLIGLLIMRYWKDNENNSTFRKLAEYATYMFALLTIGTIALDIKYD